MRGLLLALGLAALIFVAFQVAGIEAGGEEGITHNGDVNCTGFADVPGIDATDALFILRYVAGFDNHSNWPQEVCPHVGDRIVP